MMLNAELAPQIRNRVPIRHFYISRFYTHPLRVSGFLYF